jgi:methyl-accepting chemotaxis protein
MALTAAISVEEFFMIMLRALNLPRRLAILIAIFSFGFITFGVFAFQTLNELKVNGPLYHQIVQGKDLIADVLPPPEYILESYLVSFQLMATDNPAQQKELIARLETLKNEHESRHAFWSKEGLESDIADTLLKGAYVPAVTFYDVAFKDFIPALQRHDKEAVGAAKAKMKAAYDTHLRAINQVVALTNQRAGVFEAQSKTRIASATILLLAILALSLGAGIGGAILITRSITGPLQGAVDIAKAVAAGDLFSDIPTTFHDEPGQLMQALKSMNDNLSHTVGQVRASTDTIAVASQQIAAGNFDLSSRTEAQASSLEQTASAMEQISSTVRQTADHAQQANRLVLAASHVAAEGGEVVERVVAMMGTMKESSGKIADIIGVIDSIAFQTNILALNAAVEAARAGEQGRGFAVVATEVRQLAQRSASAAREIKNLIGESVDKVDVGSKLVDGAGATMKEIVTSVKQVADIMGDIAVASREQSSGLDQVKLAIQQMDEVTQQNAALVEESAAAAASMQEQAGKLIREVSVFKMDDAAWQARLAAEQQPVAPASKPVRGLLPA